jgi:hypothetical protein
MEKIAQLKIMDTNRYHLYLLKQHDMGLTTNRNKQLPAFKNAPIYNTHNSIKKLNCFNYENFSIPRLFLKGV